MKLGACKPPLILICGPTGVGKSELGVNLAKEINGEIISADSVQVYRGLNIGSAKITEEEMKGVPHHLIDILNPDEDYGVHLFQKYAKEAIAGIYERGHIPIVVGGTAFYIQALLYDIDFTEEEKTDDSYRDELNVIGSSDEGAKELWARLNSIDPDYASTVHYNNVKRVIRALEYNKHTGRLFSVYNREQSERESIYDHVYFALTDKRELLYDRINKRVDVMLSMGLIDEVKGLLASGYSDDLSSMSSIGYKEICAYLKGDCSLEDAVNLIKQNSRHYAKRQLTWLRRERDVEFVDRQDFKNSDDILEYIIKKLNGDL